MARRSFEQAVDHIRQLDASEGQVAFEMGDEVLAQVPIGRDGVNNASTVLLERLAQETGVDFEVLRQRRFVSSRVPPGTRVPGVAWAVYRQIASVDDELERQQLFDKVASEPPTQLVDGVWITPPQKRWTVDAIRTHISGKKAANPAAGSVWGLQRAFKEASAEAVAEVLEVPEVRRAVYEGLQRHEQKVAERVERQTAADPIGRHIDQQQAMLDLQRWVDVLRRHIEHLHGDILPRLGKAPVRDPMAMRHFLAEALADLDAAVGPVRHFVQTGGSDLDQFLTEVLGGSKRD